MPSSRSVVITKAFGERSRLDSVSYSVIGEALDFFSTFVTSIGAFSSLHRWEVSLLPSDVSLPVWCDREFMSSGIPLVCYL
ncbi:hypothetical protein V6N13_043494 [Hibiscus sabdariffa]